MLNTGFANAAGQEVSRDAQYLQIDFMRLFKICKELGCAKRKRNMPVDYPRDSYRALQATTRLMRTLADQLFPKSEGFDIHASRERLSIQPDYAKRSIIEFAKNHIGEMRQRPDDAELVRLFDDFMRARTYIRMDSYGYSMRADPRPRNGDGRTNFCACARELMETKSAFAAFHAAWVAQIERLKTAQEREVERQEAEMARQEEVRRAAEEARQRAIEAGRAADAEARRAGMQQAFNQSLENFRNRNRTNDERA